MNFFKKLFNPDKKEEPIEPFDNTEDLSLDQLFVQNFIQRNGKFLYCTSLEEVTINLCNIVQENTWNRVVCLDHDLIKLIKTVPVTISDTLSNDIPFFVDCEHLIAENGSILFSSNQLKDYKISELSENFIVYATTSQLVRTKGESLTGIRTHYQGNIPSNISAIKNYNPNIADRDSVSLGNTNAKNLYLLLFEDL
ncbi:hypothetical protein [Lutibacter sp.]|uniref:hypothetical protein n=1 Tax=Lutibacter sp. TaxID=1925666 RepID=UPI0027340BEC|nr:hypothetical protein [Lutibacter sp.]MDP3312178.1 hypothetical protein [Lutibacter sp.]